MPKIKHVTATVGYQVDCPLYAEGASLEFRGPRVEGDDLTPVCYLAVANLRKPVDKILEGKEPGKFEKTVCAGCTGKAYFNFSCEELQDDTMMRQRTNLVVDTLSRNALFEGASRASLERVAGMMTEQSFEPGQEIIIRGEPGRAFYIINEGVVKVVQTDQYAVDNILNELKAGDCFGEMSLITGDLTSATVMADTPVSVHKVEKEHFIRLLSLVPTLNFSLAKILAQRLAKAGTWVVEELRKGVLGRLEMITPAELIQAMNVNSQTGMLIVTQDGSDAEINIYLQDGQILFASSNSSEGENAFYEFLTWSSGNFKMEQEAREVERNIMSDTIGLLLEGMRRIDENIS
jgi:CRP-like cAMP-binding protein